MRSTLRSTTSSISISSATSRRSRASSASPIVMEVNPSVPVRTVPEFIAYAKANPGKINIASAGIGTTAPRVRRAVQDDDRRQHGRTCPIAAPAPALTDLLAGQVQVMFDNHAVVGRAHPRRQAARARGDHGDALGRAAGHPDRGRVRAGLRSEFMASASLRLGTPRRGHRAAQQGDQFGDFRLRHQSAPRRSWGIGATSEFPR